MSEIWFYIIWSTQYLAPLSRTEFYLGSYVTNLVFKELAFNKFLVPLPNTELILSSCVRNLVFKELVFNKFLAPLPRIEVEV